MAPSAPLLAAVLLLAALAVKAAPLVCSNWQVSGTSSGVLIPSGATVRKYYISAEVDAAWSYTPSGGDLCNGVGLVTQESGAATWPKARFFQYDSNTFTGKVKRDPHLGILGPVIRAVEGDYIQVTLRNKLSFAINLAPSGVKYAEPVVAAPGKTVTYIWATPASTTACNADGETSQMWHYRSTVDPVPHNAAGLFGPIVITRKGYARADGRPNDVDRELFIVLQRFDESLVPAAIRATNAPSADTALAHTVNGISYCNLKGLNATYGDRVRWYVMGLGNEDDVHTAHWHGITVQKRNQRNVDALVIVPGVTHTVDSIADNPGTWLFHCHVNHHLAQGMGALYSIAGPPYKTAPGPAPGSKTRTYYVAAEVVEWDFAPGGGDFCANGSKAAFTADQKVFVAGNKVDRIGRKYLKAQYRQYTDGTFKHLKPRTAAQAHLGIQGPTVYAEVGDRIRIVFRNKIAGHSVSIHPHGVLYAKDAEGAPYNDGTPATSKGDDIVKPGTTYTYNWAVPARAGPGPSDPSSIMWMYHSHTDEAMDTWAGLFGSIIVTRKGSARWDGTPKDVDRELVLTFSVLDESSSFLLAENAVKYLRAPASLLASIQALFVPPLPFIPNGPAQQTGVVFAALNSQSTVDGFVESNKMHSINGYSFCNLPKLTAVVGQRTRVYVQVFGDVIDLHTPNLFGGSFEEDDHSVQALHLLPGSMTTTDIRPQVAGSWLLQCRVNDHVAAGMRARLVASGSSLVTPATSGPVRKYCIAAEKGPWTYAAAGTNLCTGTAYTAAERTFTQAFIGSTYTKARYVQYTDGTFAKTVPQPATNGILGPVISAEEGEVVEIVFKNNVPDASGQEFLSSLKVVSGLIPISATVTPSRPSVAAKTVSGTDAVRLLLDAGVRFGEILTVRWAVPASAGPQKLDVGGVVAYTYLDGADEIGHTHAGLVGLVLVGSKGAFPSVGGKWSYCPAGSGFLFPLLYTIFDEAQSPFIDENVAAAKVDPAADGFGEANLKHTINGKLYCSLPALVMVEKQKGLVVLAGLGSENDMHGPVFEGQALEAAGDGVFGNTLMPSVTKVATLVAGVRGKNWHGYCYVHDHIIAGMQIKMVVNA